MTKSREYLRKLCNPAYKIWWCTLRRGARGAHCAPLQGGARQQVTGNRQQATGDGGREGSGIRGAGRREAAGNRQQATGDGGREGSRIRDQGKRRAACLRCGGRSDVGIAPYGAGGE